MKKSIIKKISLIIITITLCVVVLWGCTASLSGSVKGGEVSYDGNSVEGNYDSFDGKYTVKLGLEKGKTYLVKIEDSTEEGSISYGLTDRSNAELSLRHNMIYEMRSGGQVKIVVSAEKHKGSFEISFTEIKV